MRKLRKKKVKVRRVKYKIHRKPMTGGSELRQNVNVFMEKYLDLFDGKRVIDFGSGRHKQYGRFFSYREYIPLDKDLNGVDICKSMEVRADRGICIAVLEHSMDPVSALKNMRECLGTGYLLLGVSIKYVLHMLPDDYYRFTKEFWRVVESCGFEIIDRAEIEGNGLDGQPSSMLTMLCRGK